MTKNQHYTKYLEHCAYSIPSAYLGISMHSEMYQNNLQLGSVQISWTLTKKYNLVHLLFLDKKKILICFSVPTEEELKF